MLRPLPVQPTDGSAKEHPKAISEWRSGWPTLLGAAGATSFGSACFVYTAGYFVRPIEAELGWTRGQIAFGTTLAMIVTAIGIPLVGVLTDRFGSRTVSVPAFIGYGILCLILACVPPQLTFYYAAILAAAVFKSGATAVPFVPLVAAQFQRQRGAALGLLMSGPGIALAMLTPVLVPLIMQNWRSGYLMIGLVALLVGLPSALLATHRTQFASKGAVTGAHGMTLAEAARTTSFWKMIVAVLGGTIPVGGFLNQMTALLADKGMTTAQLAALGSFSMITLVCSRLIAGVLLDVWRPNWVALVFMLAAASGALIMLADAPSFPMCAASIVLMGCAMGSEGDIYAFFTAKLFGLRKFATIYSTFSMCTAFGLGLGAAIFGVLHDIYGSYNLALLAAAISLSVAGVCMVSLGHNSAVEKITAAQG